MLFQFPLGRAKRAGTVSSSRANYQVEDRQCQIRFSFNSTLLKDADQRWNFLMRTTSKLWTFMCPISRDPTATKAIPLSHAARGVFLMFLREPEAIYLAREARGSNNAEIIAYNPLVYLSAIGPETILGNIVELDSLVDNCAQTLGWTVAKSKYPNTIEIRTTIAGDNRAALQAFYDAVDQVALLLSSKNKFGFVAGGRCHGEMSRGGVFVSLGQTGVRTQTDYCQRYLECEECVE